MDIWREVLVLQDTDLISKTPPLLLRRLDICSLGVGIAFIARLRGRTLHSPLSHTHCDLRERETDRGGQRQEELADSAKKNKKNNKKK